MDYSYLYTWTFLKKKKKAGRKQNLSPERKKLMALVDLGEPTSFLDHGHLGCSQREYPHAKRVAWSYDMEGIAKKCVERQCKLTNKRTEQLYKVSTLWTTLISRRRNWKRLKNCPKCARKLS